MIRKVDYYIKRHEKDLSRLCFSLCKNPQDAEDLYQTTWERVIKSFKSYNREKPFEKWLWTVCVNSHKDMMQNPFRTQVVTFEDDEEILWRLSNLSNEIADLEEYMLLHKAIDSLEPELLQVVALYYFKDLSVGDISEILKIPEGTVKSRLFRAREIIRKELSSDDFGK